MTENLSLSELQKKVKETVADNFFHPLWVRCEIHDLNLNCSGHCYMDLVEKAEDGRGFIAKAKGIIWRSKWRTLSIYFSEQTGKELSAGMQVLLQVQVQYSELYGMSLIVYDIDPTYTIGDAEAQRQRTIKRLQDEGMFDMNSTLRLPRLPRRFALISASTAAGYGDFMKHIEENGSAFNFRIQLYPSPMQGENAPAGIIAAMDSIVRDMKEGASYDAVLIMRGGGSVADLACFDDYDLAVNIANFPIPVFTAVGHERDVHVCDMVAYRNVKTPTALADFIVDIFLSEDQMLYSIASRLSLALNNKFRNSYRKLDNILSGVSSAVKMRYLNENNRLDKLELRIKNGNPYEKMKSGFLMVYYRGGLLRSSAEVKKGDELSLMLRDGVVKCLVQNVEKQKIQ